MLKGFRAILLKELKELIRDPKILIGMIVVPLIMFPIFGFVLGYAAESAQQQAREATLLIVNNDNGNWSQSFVGYIDNFMKVIVVKNLSADEVVNQDLLSANNSTQFLLIPNGFSTNMSLHVSGMREYTATVKVYGVFQGGGIFSDIGSAATSGIIANFNREIAPNVLFSKEATIIKGEIQEGIDPSTLSGLMMTQSLALPITMMVMLTYAMQIAATSVAMEKEEKTLETLLTVPVDRFAILIGKLSSTIIVAGVAAITILIGYTYMFSSITMGIPISSSVDLVALGLVPSPFGYALLGITLFITLLSALALAVIISAFAEDVRGAQALVGYIYPLVFIPSMGLIYLDVNTLPLIVRAVFFAIPYSHPVLASKAVVLGDYLTVIAGIVYVAALTVVIMYLASRLFATEKILTAKLRFKRKGLFGRKPELQEEM